MNFGALGKSLIVAILLFVAFGVAFAAIGLRSGEGLLNSVGAVVHRSPPAPCPDCGGHGHP
jgi:hypothetical protein